MKIDVGQTVQIVANFGVIASIVFLGIELRENATQARIDTTQEAVAQRDAWWELIAGDEAVADIYRRGLADFNALSPLEQTRFDVLMRSFLFQTSLNIQARNASLIGLNPNFEARVLEGGLLRMLDQPGFREWWEQVDRRGMVGAAIRMIEELEAMRERPHNATEQ